MEAQEIVKLTQESIRDLLASQERAGDSATARELRRETRWPFPGTVEVWLPDTQHGERHVLATLHNISTNGMAMSTQRAIHSGIRINIAVHLPEMSCYGGGIVRHCTRSAHGYLVGVEFIFESTEEEEGDD